jgi:hypothetical protein
MLNPATSPTGKWGLYDTTTDLWFGTTDGPLRYDDETIAKMAAAVMEGRVYGHYLGDIRAMEIPDGVNKEHDRLEPRFSGEDALKRIERGIE